MNEDLFQLGVKALIRNREGKILLLKVNLEKLSNATTPYWDIPGGRIHRGDSVVATLEREVAEETGIAEIRDITPVAMVLSNIRIPLGDGDTGLILSVYNCAIPDDASIALSDEHTEYGWFDEAEAARLLSVKYPPEFTKTLGR